MMLTRQVKYFIVRFIRHDSKKTKIFVVLVLLSSISFYSWLFHALFRDRMAEDRFLGLHKCPACYGTSLCPAIKSGKLKLRGWSAVSALDLVNVKNVHTGIYHGEQQVIVKKLGRNRELRELDEALCEKSKQGAKCDVTSAIRSHPMVTSAEWTPTLTTGLSDLLACPSKRLLDLITDKFTEGADSADSDHQGISSGHMTRAYLTTLLTINPEPIILQIFPAAEGWPFPRYVGACGRLVVEEDIGSSLTNFYNAPWEERVDYAYQVMQIAERFTENDMGFAIYWTDLNYDNLAVSRSGKVIVVDAENMVVVDRARIKRQRRPGWDVPYVSEFDACPDRDPGSCVTFSVQSLCTRYTADFNYYTACRNLLSEYGSGPGRPGGLLHDLPPQPEVRLRGLLRDCARPREGQNRRDVAQRLLKELSDIRNDVL